MLWQNLIISLPRVKPGFIGRQGSSDRSFYVSFTALPTDTCSGRSYPFVFATNLLSDTWVRVFTGSGLITGSDRIGPEIGLFLCLTDFFLYKNDVYKRIMYLVQFVCI